MKNLIIYYSLEGDTKLVAELISNEIECDAIELKPKKEFARGKISKFFWGGRSVLLKQKPELSNSYIDLKQYDNIFIGTPVWCGTYTPPINTFLDKYKSDLKGKNLALFACHGGGGADKCFTNFKSELKESVVKDTIAFEDPLKKDKLDIKVEVKKWISNLKTK